jgi:hypothetical protein
VYLLYIWHQTTELSLSVEKKLKITHILLKRLFIEKPIFPHLVKKFSALYGKFITTKIIGWNCGRLYSVSGIV